MSEDDTSAKLRDTDMPPYYFDYYTSLSQKSYKLFETAAGPKSSLADSSSGVEPKIAFDLADRVAKMHDIDIAAPIRDLLETNGKEITALLLSKELALGKYLPSDASLEERLDAAVRVGLAIVTEGVTIAPLQGISDVRIRQNADNTDYLSISIAGPMRSAGGTESAVTMLIADHVRKAVGLSTYKANSFDDETGRFVEELRIYEREASNFQYHVLDEDIVRTISNLPVELDGVDTDPYEVVNHKSMRRIKTDRVRGGALRVLNDGLIGRAKKLLKRVEVYDLDGWEWLKDLKGAVQTGDKQEDAATKRMSEVITGRSVLSMPKKLGGFRLRYGRACNTGFAAVGFHPIIGEILDHTITAGTQIKIDIPGKGATVAFVDSLETPVVRLRDGSVVRIRDIKHGLELKADIEKILHLGDILISFGDFLENNAQLVPSGYVEEFWIEELRHIIKNTTSPIPAQFLLREPDLAESFQLAEDFGVPLHPKFLFYWDQITADEFGLILEPTSAQENTICYEMRCKPVLEKMGVPHTVSDGQAVLKGSEAEIFHRLLFRNTIDTKSGSVLETISRHSGIRIRAKFSTSIGARIGRPEKASPRVMKPPIHTLFPVGHWGGATRNLIKASNNPDFATRISDRTCPKCDFPSLGIRCSKCGSKTLLRYTCPSCHSKLDTRFCQRCKKTARGYVHKKFPLKEMLFDAQKRIGIRAQEPFKGVMEMINQDKISEPLEKGLIRQSRNLTVFKDGTVRFDATNCPLTHFKPAWIGTPVSKLRELGYLTDADGQPLESPEQTVELLMQDVVIPYTAGRYLTEVCRYVDQELEHFYGGQPFYHVKGTDDLVGHLIIGLAPHTSVGIVGRVIGFANTQVCFATPNWHSAKRRDADGDADSIMLLLDTLLNFSRRFLSDKIGGLMDAPLLIQPLVFPHESQSQAHNLEVVRRYPLEFFESTMSEPKAADISSVEMIKSRLDTSEQFHGYHFTHPTSSLVTSQSRSAYSTLNSMLDKLDLQIRNADIINAVDTNEIVSNLISTHLIPDIMGNLRSYARQSFRCTLCRASYRRPPLIRRCNCGHQLIQTITRSSVEKYLKLAKRLVEKYHVSRYQMNRILVLSDEIDLVFGKSRGDQALLTDYA